MFTSIWHVEELHKSLSPRLAEYTTFITLHNDSSLILSNCDKDACKSAFFRHKIQEVDQQSIPHVAMYCTFTSYKQSSRFNDFCSSICAADCITLSQCRVQHCNRGFEFHRMHYFQVYHASTKRNCRNASISSATTSVCLPACLYSRDKYRTAELILTKLDIVNFCNFFSAISLYWSKYNKNKGHFTSGTTCLCRPTSCATP